MFCGKDKKGKWFVQFSYKDWTGKRVRTTKRGFKTKREAQDYYSNFIVMKQGEMDMLFKDFVAIYLDDMKSRIKENTLISKRYIINLKILPYFGEKRINEISVSDVRQWQASLMEQGYADTYLSTIQIQLSAIFNYASKYYQLSNNPCKVAGGMGKHNAGLKQIYTREQFDNFCNCLMNKRISWMGFQVLYYTGVRIGEMLALQIKDVDFEKKQLVVNKSYQRINMQDVITEPKTPRSNRVISLPDFLLVDLKDYIDSMGVVAPTDRLFPATKHFFENEKSRAVKESGMPDIRVHDFRHSHASLLIEMGFSPIAVADRLGHEKVSTTLNTYGHLFPNKQMGMAEKLNDMYREGL
jgi:integrase